MLKHDTREKLENIIRGIVVEGAEDHCTATRNFLCEGYSTSSTVKKDFDRQSIIKKEQAESLKLYSTLFISMFTHFKCQFCDLIHINGIKLCEVECFPWKRLHYPAKIPRREKACFN